MDEILKKSDVGRVIQKYRFETIKSLFLKDLEFWQTITGIRIAVTYNLEKKTKNFQCVYMHHTDAYNINNYHKNEDHEEDLNDSGDEIKDTKIDFGYVNDSFYIVGSKVVQVYAKRETPDIPIAFNVKYEAQLSDYEQSELLEGYSENKNIPEWFAVTFFRALKLGHIKIVDLINELYFD